ncbi:LysM peptidoglycan-binding domain-containing protein [Ancylomarina euxinus]|uniref:Peptidoglycan hydrolase n=1 Tax=Ancylomarina euxinus TaxID=2283627 RepID=A0A425Y5C2_9BACT|nr:glucosaminidase domain-containing protein [Ancylomarina euxinus]MCZ4694287.1 glucosaminidase domain-containing protein [Ancylomarina euxinus]MUP14382.1 LysM peptidoglycan-binding domain-containing protein [Ancylomarina euxinus]RRG23692.1 LysM peptidoglycan-binding domain-containing protein [Ancylomarina euxinus]
MKLYKSLLLLITCCLFSTLAFAEKNSRQIYIAKYKELAIAEMKRTGIPASITLAQGLLESGNGNSTLAAKANNHFGIKCHDWTGPSIEIDDDKKNECFRKYKDPYQSYKDHSEFLTSRSRYEFLFKLKPTDYKGWAKGLKKAGYATHPKYAHMLIDIIEEEELYLFDSDAKKYESKRSEKSSFEKNLGDLDLRLEVANGVHFVKVIKGDTFYNLEKNMGISRSKLLKYNELPKDYVLGIDQILYFHKKRNKAARGYNFHLVKSGENLYDIAQKYCVKLKRIRKLNGFSKRDEVSEGDRVYLRKR